MKKILKSLIIVVSFQLNFQNLLGQVILPKLISDGMVLQREANIKIWGWASPNEKVSLQFLSENYTTTASSSGEWSISLGTLTPGGPYSMVIEGNNRIIILSDILVGDVWLCSGQSNMELPMRRVAWVYPNEIANSKNPHIRHFNVPTSYNFKEKLNDIESGSWIEADPENVLDFSAVAYFFAKEVYAKTGVPIGLINSSLGGSGLFTHHLLYCLHTSFSFILGEYLGTDMN